MFIELLSVIIPIAFIILMMGLIFYIQGPPYVQTDDKTVAIFLEYIRKHKKKNIIDLGSGDGKLLIAIAHAGFKVTGIEINPLLVFKSRQLIKKHKLNKKAKVIWGSFWNIDLSSYDCVVVYGIKHIMKRLGNKMTKELPSKALILTNYFIFPQWKEYERKGKVRIYYK